MKIKTTRFGELDVPEGEILAFPRGLVGFPDLRRFILFDHPGGGPFRWLQAADRPEAAFVVTDPLLFFPDYRVRVSREELEAIRVGDVDDGMVVVILVVPGDPRGITANLMGPVIINVRERLGMQLVLSSPEYTTKHPIFAKEGVPQGA